MKSLLKPLVLLIDLALCPLVLPAALLMKLLRIGGMERFRLCRRVLSWVGVFPVIDHYYEPLLNSRRLLHPLDQPRRLPGVDLNIPGQLELLEQLRFGEELRPFLAPKVNDLTFTFKNGLFESGDAEFWYSLVRQRKPKRIVEIGSGNSTLLAIEAVRRNQAEQPGYSCRHVCIEPYEMRWLERSGVTVLRERVELTERSLFTELEAGDLLFIDSSHVIRPQGDVLCEYLDILPRLKPGVAVHVHDIFTPRDYPHSWVVDKVRFWNEQYLLEALLSGNRSWKVIGALNHLKHDHFDALRAACPFLTPDREPGSFYIERVG